MKVKVVCIKDDIWMDRVDTDGNFLCSKCQITVHVEIPIE